VKCLPSLLLLLVVVCGLAGYSPLSASPTPEIPRGLVLQEGGAELAASYGVPMAAKRWPAAYGFGAIDNELAKAQMYGVKLGVGWMWQNETYTGAPCAVPTHWDKVCWEGVYGGCGPNYANPVTRAQMLQTIRDFGARYDGHPQIAAVMMNVGDDGERRFCKKPLSGECREAYDAAGLTEPIWAGHVADVARTFKESFTKTPVLGHYSGFGYNAWEVGRDAKVMVDAGLYLMSSGLYPAMCSGNSYGGHCNPLVPMLNDWQIPSLYPNVPLATEQSLAYTGGQAAMAWLWAVTHGAEQIHAQRQTLESSRGTEWREMAEYHLAHPNAAIWVAWEATPGRCAFLGRPYYCPEIGNWSRNVIEATYGPLGLNVGTSYMGWAARQGPVALRTTITGPVQVIVWKANGDRLAWQQDSGEGVNVNGTDWIHRVEVRQVPIGTVTPTATRTREPIATRTPLVPTYTASPTATATTAPPTASPSCTPRPTWMVTPTEPAPTDTPTPEPTTPLGPPTGWRVTGKIGPFRVNLEIRPFWE